MRFKKCKCCKKRKPLTTKGGVCLKCEWVLLSEEFSYEVDSKGQILEDVAFQKAKVVIGQLIGMDQEATGTC